MRYKLLLRQKLKELFLRRVDTVIPNKDKLQKLLLSGKRLRIYQGFDPTSPYLHIGHLVGLLTLKDLQQLGHEIIIVLGSFSATIGNPSGKNSTRPILTFEKVVNNAKNYQQQLEKILDFHGSNPARIRFNSDWLGHMNVKQILQLAYYLDAEKIFFQPMFQERLKKEYKIHLHELLYPLLITQDAISLDVDVEVGGKDILFNMTIGQKAFHALTGREKYVIATKLLEDNQGRKMSKTEGLMINLSDRPEVIRKKVDQLDVIFLIRCLQLATTLPLGEVKLLIKDDVNQPQKLRKILSDELIKILHS